MGRKPRSDEKREQIIEALYECLAEAGHEKVSVKTIAARAGLTPGVIHYYFEAKDDITIGLAETIISQYSGLLQQAVAAAGPGRSQVDTLLEFLMEHFVFDVRLNRVFYNLIQMGFERRGLTEITRKLLAAYRGQVSQAFESAGLDRARAETLGAALVALVEGLALQWTVEPGVFDEKQVRGILENAIKMQIP